MRRGDEVFAVGATCTHYGGPLAEGLVVGDTVRCPWHHACFSLRTGEALRAPALNPIALLRRRAATAIASCVGAEQARRRRRRRRRRRAAKPIVIVGGGAAGNAAAEMLRREGYAGELIMLSADSAPPGRPPQPVQGLPRRHRARGVDPAAPARVLRRAAASSSQLGARVAAHRRRRAAASTLDDGRELALRRAAARDRRRAGPADDAGRRPAARALRCARSPTAAPSSRAPSTAKRAVVIGASFIGLEVGGVAARARLEVHVVAPETRPLERVLGPELGDFVRALHEEHGVVFHLGKTAARIEARRGRRSTTATALAADLVVVGIGVRPALGARRAGAA